MQTVNDLSTVVQKELKRRGVTPPTQLAYMLETMYLASLATEEGVPIRVHVSYANPATTDVPPQGSLMREIGESLRLGHDRWRGVPLSKASAFSPKNIVKMGVGTDPQSSALLAYEFEGRLRIWGVADLQGDFVRFSTHDAAADEEPDRPGDFQVHIEGTGHLRVLRGFERIAELRGGELLPCPLDVLSAGPVFGALKPMVRRFYSGLLRPGQSKFLSLDMVERVVLSTLHRLLIRTENLNRGGAFLIAPKIPNKDVHITNELGYTRLLEGILSDALGKANYAALTVFSLRVFEAGHDLPVNLWVTERTASERAREASRILDGAIWFTALLSKIDGLVLLDYHLFVRGFGAVLAHTDMPSGVGAFQATDVDARESTLRPLDLEHFGTRHRSMAAFCARNPGSIGFVLSKDGGVRVFMRVKRRLIMWDNVMIHQSPMSPEAIRMGVDLLRETLKEGEVFDRERDNSRTAPSSDSKSKELNRILEKEYRRLFRTSAKGTARPPKAG